MTQILPKQYVRIKLFSLWNYSCRHLSGGTSDVVCCAVDDLNWTAMPSCGQIAVRQAGLISCFYLFLGKGLWNCVIKTYVGHSWAIFRINGHAASLVLHAFSSCYLKKNLLLIINEIKEIPSRYEFNIDSPIMSPEN